jgi:hypothetical protein
MGTESMVDFDFFLHIVNLRKFNDLEKKTVLGTLMEV